MKDISILIGGKAGFGIDKAGIIIGRVLGLIGYSIYIYRDYPSIIRGGHTFSIVRAANERVAAHTDMVDFILALNQDTIDLHLKRLSGRAVIIYDSDAVNTEKIPAAVRKIGIPMAAIIKDEKAADIARNVCVIGSLCKALGIEWDIADAAFRKEVSRELEINLKVARRGYDAVGEVMRLGPISSKPLPMISGNHAVGLGLIKGGLDAYLSYPMTPTSPVLHFLADIADDFGIKVIHPESEISVMLMALGFAYAGQRAAVGTAGGGFCLMTEGLSLSGMAELPVVFVVGQRPGPSTGLPTYSCQTELHFVLSAGQGEFARFIAAPGDCEEAYLWSALAMDISWKYQIPSFILTDKNIGEGMFNFDIDSVGEIRRLQQPAWDGKAPYKRYLNVESGISPMAFPGDKGAVVKVSSYEHDEYGITTEDPNLSVMMADKRLGKEKSLLQELEEHETVRVYGNRKSPVSVLCWGSNKGVCVEAAGELGLKVIQPVVLSPFPVDRLKESLNGTKRLICVESNATGQLARLIKGYGFDVDAKVLKYDGRPFSVEELKGRLAEVIK